MNRWSGRPSRKRLSPRLGITKSKFGWQDDFDRKRSVSFGFLITGVQLAVHRRRLPDVTYHRPGGLPLGAGECVASLSEHPKDGNRAPWQGMGDRPC